MKIFTTLLAICLWVGVPACTFSAMEGVEYFREQETLRKDAIMKMQSALSTDRVKDKATADVAAKEFTIAVADLSELTEKQALTAMFKLKAAERDVVLKMLKEQSQWQMETMRGIEKRAKELCARKCYGSEKLQQVLEELFCIVEPQNVPRVKPRPKR